MTTRPILVLFRLHSRAREANFHHLLHKRGSGSDTRRRLADLHAPTPGHHDPR